MSETYWTPQRGLPPPVRPEELGKLVEDVVQEQAFSGVVRVDRGTDTLLNRVYGLADRVHGLSNGPETRFAIASGTKGFTALVVVSLIADGTLELSTTARSLLGKDLPLVPDDVTVEDLLSHRSGIGDYLDEELNRPVDDYLLTVPVHELDSTEAYLKALDGYPPKFARGARFSYCNSGFVVLALMAERAAGLPFRELVRRRVSEPAGLSSTDLLRSDELPRDAARGYLSREGVRTNVFHLPVLGSGDGGLYSTAGDLHRLWGAFFAGAIVPPSWVAEMLRPRGEGPKDAVRYGLGFWLYPSGNSVGLEGYDAGVSMRTVRHPETGVTWTVISNTSQGAWPVVRCLADRLGS